MRGSFPDVPGGCLAVWAYGRHSLNDPNLDRLQFDFYNHTVGPYWPPQRRLIEEGYRSIPFPFAELTPPPFCMETRWRFSELIGYLGTWSAVTRYREAQGNDPLVPFAATLATAWGNPETPRPVTWPLAVRIGRSHEAGSPGSQRMRS